MPVTTAPYTRLQQARYLRKRETENAPSRLRQQTQGLTERGSLAMPRTTKDVERPCRLAGSFNQKPGNELNFVKAQFRAAHNRNFRNPYDVSTGDGMGNIMGQTRVIISTRYREIGVSPERMDEEMRKFVGPSGYAIEAMWIEADGRIHVYK